MKRLLAGLMVMVVIAGLAVLLVIENHKVAYSARNESGIPAADSVKKATPTSASLSGKVLETMDSGGYTYVLLETNSGKKWVAAPKTSVTVGKTASFAPGTVMRNFKSETLNRTFAEVVFSPGKAGAHMAAASAGGACPGGGSKSGKMGSSGMGSMGTAGMGAMKSPGRITVPPLDLKIEKAQGKNAYTVAEIYAQGEKLDKKKVAVRGKVVKVSPNIMGRNWIHLQDGSGKPETGTHDLVLTSQQKPTVGEILTAEGILAADKDFGAGYRYDVIIEETQFK